MLLAVNVENSHISVGVFDESDALCAKFQIAADLCKTPDEYAVLIHSILRERDLLLSETTDAIVSSVVPQLTHTVVQAVRSIANTDPLTVGPGVKTGFPIKIDTPSELGGDIVADIAAVLELLKQSGRASAAIVANVGTVTTVSAVNQRGEYVGCSIFPGVRSSFELLHGKTAQLPNVSLSEPSRAIGKNSQDAVRSGVILGHAMMLDGFVEQFAREIKCPLSELSLFITGDNARFITSALTKQYMFDGDLTLKGLLALYRNTARTV